MLTTNGLRRSALQKYSRHYNLQTENGTSRDELIESVMNHFLYEFEVPSEDKRHQVRWRSTAHPSMLPGSATWGDCMHEKPCVQQQAWPVVHAA